MRNDIIRLAPVATEPEIVENDVFLSPQGRGETYVRRTRRDALPAGHWKLWIRLLKAESQATENLYVILP